MKICSLDKLFERGAMMFENNNGLFNKNWPVSYINIKSIMPILLLDFYTKCKAFMNNLVYKKSHEKERYY